ncbi:hypothetical protein [Sphingomonas flavalba]|uniref:hypothetical protein n=1 Tax=Sphingomonas flavalba TaxID=2559804 RepID=UPI00109DA0C1|nr:hypothetical protein [Sphingomonas flavalba]
MESPNPYPRALAHGLLAFIALILATLVWGVVEMVLLQPGRTMAYYGDAVSRFYVGAGIVLVGLFAWRAARRMPMRPALIAGLVVAGVSIVAELAAFLVMPDAGNDWRAASLSIGTKLIAGLAGGWLAGRARPAVETEDAVADGGPTPD